MMALWKTRNRSGMPALLEIPDFLPLPTAEEARALFQATEFDPAPFEDPEHFNRRFPLGGPGIPSPDELYTTSFSRKTDLAQIKAIAHHHIVPKVKEITGRDSRQGRLYCYKMHQGDHIRLHTDNYAGHTGFVWHLSKDWKWDWGGLLITVEQDMDTSKVTATATLPKFNALTLIDHAAAVPHTVTQIAPWAKEPRMIVTGILG